MQTILVLLVESGLVYLGLQVAHFVSFLLIYEPKILTILTVDVLIFDYAQRSCPRSVLYHFNQFVRHASRTLRFWRNFPAVTHHGGRWANPFRESTKKIDQKWAKIWYFGGLSQRFSPLAETKISANVSRVTPMGELIEMVQYAFEL